MRGAPNRGMEITARTIANVKKVKRFLTPSDDKFIEQNLIDTVSQNTTNISRRLLIMYQYLFCCLLKYIEKISRFA